MIFLSWFSLTLFINSVAGLPTQPNEDGPFLQDLGNQTWIIGNELWNMTQNYTFGTQLFYKDHDCVGSAWGHYTSYNGAASNLNYTSAEIVKSGTREGKSFIDVEFVSPNAGELHWVIFSGLAGAYQYFINRGLPELGEFRSLWRLDNETFTYGHTDIKDELLPPLSDYIASLKVQDETWLQPDGTGYITKYDWTSWIRTQTYYGVYNESFGSWYINPGKDYYNGDHTKQELMVHRESATGDTVQLNMIHGTHFMVSSDDVFPDGKMWGPWLWYLNDGSKEDAAAQAEAEFAAWPYAWLDDADYHSRGSVKGQLTLSDGRPASNAAVFLGDNHPNKTTLDMGSTYYYTDYADEQGQFEIKNVRSGTYGFQSWSNGSTIADVTTTFLQNDVVVTNGTSTDLGNLTWMVSNKTKIFQIGDFDRFSYGFLYGGAPHEHALVENCPADLTYTVGESEENDWCFGQSKIGNWTINFTTASLSNPNRNATLHVSLAGYSSGVSSDILANGIQIGNLTSDYVGDGLLTDSLLNDPSVYRSGTTAGEWRYFPIDFDASVLKNGSNSISFQVTRNSTWHGFMWDSIILEL